MNPATVILWELFVVVMAILLQRATGWMTRFSIFTTALSALFLRFGPLVPLFDRVNPQVTFVDIPSEALIRYYVSLALTFVGILAGSRLLRSRASLIRPRPVMREPPSQVVVLTSLFVMSVVALVWMAIPWGDFVGGFNLFLSATHTAEDFHRQRTTYGQGIAPWLTYLGAFFRFALLPAVIWILFFLRRRRKVLAILFWVGFVMSIAIAFSAGQKADVIFPLVGYLVARYVEGSVISGKKAVAFVALLLVIIPGLVRVQYPTLSWAESAQFMLFRLTGEENRVAQLRFIIYPDIAPHLLGASSPVIRGVVGFFGAPVEDVQSPQTFIPNLVGGTQGAVYQGTWNAAFFADAWADFGYLGVFVESIMVGVLLRSLANWYERGSRGPLERGLYTALCVAGVFLTEANLLTVLWTFGLLSSFVLYWVLLVGRTTGTPPLKAVVSRSERGPWIGPPASIISKAVIGARALVGIGAVVTGWRPEGDVKVERRSLRGGLSNHHGGPRRVESKSSPIGRLAAGH